MREKGLTPIVIVVLIALGIIGGYFIYQIQNKQNYTSNKTAPSQQTAQPSLTAVDETAKWKTFSGDKFTFKYPPDWEDITNGQAPDYPDKAEALIRSPVVVPGTEPLRYVLTINVKSEASSRSLDQVIDEHFGGIDSLKRTSTKIAGHDAIYVEGFPSAYGAIEVFTLKNSTLFAFLFEPQNPARPEWKTKEYTEIFNKILSTFQFAD